MADADPRRTFNVHDAKSNLSKLIDRAHAGEEIVLAKAGVTWAKIVPFADPDRPRRQSGRWPELRDIPDVAWFDPMPEAELDAWDGKFSSNL